MSETSYDRPTGYDQPAGYDQRTGCTSRANVYLDVSEWGWVHIILGGIVLLSGIGLFSGNIIARAVAVIVASISLLVNFFFIPVYPLWALTVIVIDVLVIWAVTAHGREMREA